MPAKYFNGTYYYVSDNYKPTEQVQKPLMKARLLWIKVMKQRIAK